MVPGPRLFLAVRTGRAPFCHDPPPPSPFPFRRLLCARQMRHVAAYLMLLIGGNAAPTAANIKSVLDAAGIAGDDADIEKLLASVEGKVRAGVLGGPRCAHLLPRWCGNVHGAGIVATTLAYTR